jgi:hypothetical protein
MLSVGYGTNDLNQALSYEQVRNYWYHWFMATAKAFENPGWAEVVLHGQADAVHHPDTSACKEGFFTSRYERILLEGVGHVPQRKRLIQLQSRFCGLLRSLKQLLADLWVQEPLRVSIFFTVFSKRKK